MAIIKKLMDALKGQPKKERKEASEAFQEAVQEHDKALHELNRELDALEMTLSRVRRDQNDKRRAGSR